MALPIDLEYKTEYIPVRDLILDYRVNPREPSIAWARRQLSKGYSRALLGVFTVSRRENGDQALLDGANRQGLMIMAADDQHPVQCNVFTDLTLELEAQIAAELNDRRQWTGIRLFQAQCTMGNKTALQILGILTGEGWAVGTDSGPGVIRGVKPFERLIVTAGQMAASELGARRGTEAWNAAMESGRADAFRVMETAVQVYNAAWHDKPSGYAADIMYAIALVILKYQGSVDVGRLTKYLQSESMGQRSFRNDANAIKGAMRLGPVDAYAFQAVTYYNTGLRSDSKAALAPWTKTAR